MKRLPAALALLLSIAGIAQAQTVEDGYAAYKSGNYASAKIILMPLAEAGDAKAMNLVGRMLENGWGFPKDWAGACDWYEKSANAGYLSAMQNISICYENGVGRKKNMKRSIYWAEQAADHGDPDSAISLIRLYLNVDRDRAILWGQKAVDQGSALARAAMWGYDLPHTGPQASISDIVCSYVMIGMFGKDWNYCDGN